jgi:hypothetical protein
MQTAGVSRPLTLMNYLASITVRNLFVKLRRDLWAALDAVEEARSGDLAMAERNLTEGATLMLSLASEIRGTLRQ